jgi:hypothetical protein
VAPGSNAHVARADPVSSDGAGCITKDFSTNGFHGEGTAPRRQSKA